MKIHTRFTALVLSQIATPSRDGSQTYYKMSLMDKSSGEAGTVKCTEEVAKTLIPMKEYECVAEYNDTFNPPTFRVTAIALASPVSDVDFPPIDGELDKDFDTGKGKK